MLGGITIIVGVVFGVVSLLVTGSFGGDEEELVSETVSSGESIDIVVEDDGVVVSSTEPSAQTTHTPTTSPAPAVTGSREDNANDEAVVYESEDGTTRVETQVTEGHAQVKVRQNVTSSGSVKSKTHIKVSAE